VDVDLHTVAELADILHLQHGYFTPT
jgi:hypothetical protein